jgi:hypothetical protein
MRFLALPVLVLTVLTGCSAAWAEPTAVRLVQVFKQVCSAPTTPEGILHAGEVRASAERWKLLGSAQTPLPIMHNHKGPKISYSSAWDLDEAAPSHALLMVSIVRPEIPGVKHSVCSIVPKLDIERAVLAKTVEEQFGPVVVRDTGSRFANAWFWHFTQEKSAGNCGRQIVIHEQRELREFGQHALLFNDFAYPDDGNWVGARAGTFCRN